MQNEGHPLQRWGKILVGILGVVVIALFVVRLISNEDAWVCENGTWIAHGQPSSPMPVGGCESPIASVQQTPRTVDPAVVHCTETRKGKLNLSVQGEEAVAYCELPDGTSCEIKALLQGTCGSIESTTSTATSSASSNQTVDVTGHIVRNTPGLTPNTWYLIYEKPGQPALRTKLIFDGTGVCEQVPKQECPVRFSNSGSLVRVQGLQEGDAIRVKMVKEVK